MDQQRNIHIFPGLIQAFPVICQKIVNIHKIIQNVGKRIVKDHTVLGADMVIEQLRMGAADDEIVIPPVLGDRGKGQGRVAGGDHDGILLYIVGGLEFCESARSVDGIEEQIIVVVILFTQYQLVVAGESEFFYVKRK